MAPSHCGPPYYTAALPKADVLAKILNCGRLKLLQPFIPFSGLFMTDGLKYVTDKLGLQWFIDTVLSYQGNEDVKVITFQIWTLERITSGEKAGQWRVVFIS